MTLGAYVEQQFGKDQAKKLANIRRGGDNNSKGTSFETYYAAAKVCEVAANQIDLDDFVLSSQELAFVDDLCLRQQSTAHKENYQAKNSDGGAAAWDAEMECRFRMQMQIDTEFHNCQKSRQILLVSCPNMAAANDGKIPADLKANCFSEFFPYDPGATKLLYASPQLRENLKAICNTDNLAVLDVAFRCVVSAWSCDDKVRSVGDVIGRAKADSRPNVFRESLPERPGIPDWLHRLCLAFHGLDPRVEFGNFKVSYNGFEVGLGSAPAEPGPEVLESFGSIGDVFAFFMSQAQKEL
jgi:hypothetical protein